MAIKFRKSAIKFLEKADSDVEESIREALAQLIAFFEAHGVLPFTEFDIKKLKGDWEGFYRLRLGKNRILFKIDDESNDFQVHRIGARGDIYK